MVLWYMLLNIFVVTLHFFKDSLKIKLKKKSLLSLFHQFKVSLLNKVGYWFKKKTLLTLEFSTVLYKHHSFFVLWVLWIWEHILTSKVCSINNNFLLSVLFHAKMIATSDEWEWLTAVYSSWWQVFINGWHFICLCVYILRNPRCWITSCDGGGGSVCV